MVFNLSEAIREVETKEKNNPITNNKLIIKNGFRTSMGWNLGKNNKSIHLLEPLTSTPMNGTKNKEISEIKKRKIEYLYNWFEFKDENIKIRDIPINT